MPSLNACSIDSAAFADGALSAAAKIDAFSVIFLMFAMLLCPVCSVCLYPSRYSSVF